MHSVSCTHEAMMHSVWRIARCRWLQALHPTLLMSWPRCGEIGLVGWRPGSWTLRLRRGTPKPVTHFVTLLHRADPLAKRQGRRPRKSRAAARTRERQHPEGRGPRRGGEETRTVTQGAVFHEGARPGRVVSHGAKTAAWQRNSEGRLRLGPHLRSVALRGRLK